MSRSITDARQVTLRAFLQQIANAASYAGTSDAKPANQSELDNLLSSLNNEVTPLLRMSASSTPNLVVTIGAGKLTNAESSYTRAIPHVGTAYVQFAAGTLTFPASSGGNIVAAPGNPSALTLGVGNYSAVLVYLDGNGNINTIVGAEDASETVAITNLAPTPDDTLPIGYVVVHNTAGVIDAIVQSKVSQFGTGAGGGGSGNVTAVESALRDYNSFAQTKYLDPNIFKQSKSTKVDGASTGVFDLVKSAFKFTSIGQTFVSTNLANAEFLAEGVDITDLHLYNHWLLNFVDTAATYEASRDGGTNWSPITMTRVGSASNAYRGYLAFADESVQQSVVTVAPTGAGSALNATTQQQLSSKLILASTTVVRTIDLNLNYGGVGTGTFKVQLVKDSAGSPSTALADLVSESNLVTISTANLGTGNVTKSVIMPQVTLVAGTYHIVMITDAAYKAGTLDLSWRSGAGTNGANYNGTAWTAGQASKAFVQKGRVHDLRIRITAGTALKYLEGMGVYFPTDDGILQPNGTKNVQRFYFTGDENKTSFDLNWVPDPDLLDILDPKRGQVYAIEAGVAKISGQTVTFEPDTFNFPGESIVLIFRQVKGIAIDNSDSNAAKNSEQDTNLLDIGNQISELDFVTIPTMAVPNTTIVNRSAMPDLSQDLTARMGLNRIAIQSAYQLQNEFGANGEPVFGIVNDRLNQIRLVGGGWAPSNTSQGLLVEGVTNNYIEVTFYGTGLNLLTTANGVNQDWKASVDGGAYGTDFVPALSSILTNRNYSANIVLPVINNLSLGIHTVSIRADSAALFFSGLEILNESSTIKVNPGSQYVKGKKLTLASQQSPAHNTTFETGTLGTRGGRVLVYQKSDGTIAKAVIPTDSAQANLTSASHSNEEVARTYYPREFGAGRNAAGTPDDFSLEGATARNRTFTLDDGTTTLVGQNTFVATGLGKENVGVTNSGSNFITFTFVGTGLDIEALGLSSGTFSSVQIDGGASVGTIAPSATTWQVFKVVSGLPYGTHTVKFLASGIAAGISKFIVYQPKTPTLPVGAKAINAYNIMANFVANATAGVTTISTGTLRKLAPREVTYVNGTGGTTDWSFSAISVANNICGFEISSNRTNAYFEYTFFGTGFDLRFLADTNSSGNITVSVDGLTFNTTNFASQAAAATTYGTGVSFTPATGILDQLVGVLVAGAGFVVTGLTLGKHTVRFNNNTASAKIEIDTIDIITPIHSHKSNLYADIQNTLSVGSQGIEDLRKIKSLEQITDQKAWARATSVSASGSVATTIGVTFVPMPDMSVILKKANAGPVRLEFSAEVFTGASSGCAVTFYINGQQYGTPVASQAGSGANEVPVVALSEIIYLPAGVHKIDVYWSGSSSLSTVGSFNYGRTLLAYEI